LLRLETKVVSRRKIMPNDPAREQAKQRAGENWHQRREQGQYGTYGAYGSSDDQWDIDRPPAEFTPAGRRYGILPEAVRMKARSFAPGYEPYQDAQPYRNERIYAGGPERYDEVGNQGTHAPKDEPLQPPVRGTDSAGASLPDQFAGADSMVQNSSTPGWKTGEQVMHAPSGSRSDEDIRHDICERLAQSRDIDVDGVSVRVSQGVVTLEGDVAHRGMKHAMGKLAAGCAGVSDVDNRISVRSESQVKNDSGLGLSATTDDSQVLHGRQI
jgi:hypothetical protein